MIRNRVPFTNIHYPFYIYSFFSVHLHMTDFPLGISMVYSWTCTNKPDYNSHTTNQQKHHRQTVREHPNHTQPPASLLLPCQTHSLTWVEENIPGTWHRLVHHILLCHQRCKEPTDGLAMAFLVPEILLNLFQIWVLKEILSGNNIFSFF